MIETTKVFYFDIFLLQHSSREQDKGIKLNAEKIKVKLPLNNKDDCQIGHLYYFKKFLRSLFLWQGQEM
jgi:hypothetical protein